MADVLKSEGDLDGSQELLEPILNKNRQLAEQLDTPASRRDLSISLIRVVDIAQANGELPKASELFKELATINI